MDTQTHVLIARLKFSLLTPQPSPDATCKLVWSTFMDVCHRVRSLDPNHGWYKTQGDNPNYYALTDRVPNNFAIYALYRRWQKPIT